MYNIFMKKMISGLNILTLFLLVILIVCITFLSGVVKLHANSKEQDVLSSQLQCNGEYGVTCDDIKDGFREGIPNYRIHGLSSEDRIDGVPDAYQIIALNISALGSKGDSKINGLSNETIKESNQLDEGMPFSWRVGVIGTDGSAIDGHITVFVDDFKNIEPIKRHLYLGLSKDDIKFVESHKFLEFYNIGEDKKLKDGTITSKAKKISDYANDWKITMDQIDNPEKYNWPGTKKQLIGSGIELRMVKNILTLTRSSKDYWPTLSQAFRKGFKIEDPQIHETQSYLDENNKRQNYEFKYFLNVSFDQESDFGIMNSEGDEAIDTPQSRDDQTRDNDRPEFAGGATLDSDNPAVKGQCTSGVTVVDKATGTRYSTVASHCGNNGTEFSNNGRFYGTQNNKSKFPEFDASLLKGGTYNQWMWMDGKCSNPSTICEGKDCIAGSNCGDKTEQYREIVGAGDTTVGTVYCASGHVTRSVCNAKVSAHDVFYENEYGKTYHVDRYESTNGDAIAVKGDSGGPVYTRNSENRRANFKGWISGINNSHSPKLMWASMYYPISDHLNINIFYLHTKTNGVSKNKVPSVYTDDNYLQLGKFDPAIDIKVSDYRQKDLNYQFEAFSTKPEGKYISRPWSYVRKSSDDTLQICTDADDIHGKEMIHVIETDDYVLIGNLQKYADPNAASNLLPLGHCGSVRLKEPLGSRGLYHAKLTIEGGKYTESQAADDQDFVDIQAKSFADDPSQNKIYQKPYTKEQECEMVRDSNAFDLQGCNLDN
jgi:hypothetical protein